MSKPGRGGSAWKISPWRTVCIVSLFCAATAVASPAQTLTTLYSFCSQPNCSDGRLPAAELVQATDGNFYGTTWYGGSSGGNCSDVGCGTIFKITPSGTLTTLHTFIGPDGALPAGLIQATDGNFYGTTSGGGASDEGTVFKITLTGTLTMLHSFNDTDGAYPEAELIQATDGNFYGTTYRGGASSDGTVFKITPSGTLTTLHSFANIDGANPWARLIQATDGNFYGTTYAGGFSGDKCGDNGCGTVFKITPSGTLTTLHSFANIDGANPWSMVQGTDGNLYGTTYDGGSGGNCGYWGCGTVFKITPSGALTLLYAFNGNGPDGADPYVGRLMQASDGNFYGTTTSGGGASGGGGTVFKITPEGTLTTLYSFDYTEGFDPYAGLIQATDNNFYGTTSAGGFKGDGTVFELAAGIVPSPVQFVPVTPCRLLDTRQDSGGPLQGGTFEFFNLPQLAQMNGCADLSSAAAYSLNVTVVPHEPLGYLTIWPTERQQPLVSTLNSYDARVKAVAAIVPGGASEAVSVYVTNTTDVILDIDGYFVAPSPQTVQFYPLPPCRVADTRDPTYPKGLGPPYLSGGVPRNFPILNATSCNIPSSAKAYSFNFTAVPHQSLGYLTVWPTGQNQPVVSTLNAYGGQVTANAAIVPAGTGGEISAFAFNDTDLVIDINGYFAAPGQNGLSLYPVAPCRVLDTRPPLGNGPFLGTLSPPMDPVNSPCAVPKMAQAYVFNATVVPTGVLGYLTLWPDGGQQPYVSTLNAYDGTVTSNMAIVPAGNQGKVDAYAYQYTAPTNLILDISGYLAP